MGFDRLRLDSGNGNNSVIAAAGSIIVGYVYDAVGNLTQEILPDPVSGLTFSGANQSGATTVSGVIVTGYAYDLASRLKTVTLPDPDGAAGSLAARSRRKDGRERAAEPRLSGWRVRVHL